MHLGRGGLDYLGNIDIIFPGNCKESEIWLYCLVCRELSSNSVGKENDMSDMRIRVEDVVGMPEFVRVISEAPGHEHDHCSVEWRTRKPIQSNPKHVRSIYRGISSLSASNLVVAAASIACWLSTVGKRTAMEQSPTVTSL